MLAASSVFVAAGLSGWAASNDLGRVEQTMYTSGTDSTENITVT